MRVYCEAVSCDCNSGLVPFRLASATLRAALFFRVCRRRRWRRRKSQACATLPTSYQRLGPECTARRTGCRVVVTAPRRRSVADHDPVRQLTTIARHVDASSALVTVASLIKEGIFFFLMNIQLESARRACPVHRPLREWKRGGRGVPCKPPRRFPPCRFPVSKR